MLLDSILRMLSRSYAGRTESQNKEGSMLSRATENRGQVGRSKCILVNYMCRGECQKKTPILETHPEGWEEATPRTGSKIKTAGGRRMRTIISQNAH